MSKIASVEFYKVGLTVYVTNKQQIATKFASLLSRDDVASALLGTMKNIRRQAVKTPDLQDIVLGAYDFTQQSYICP